MTCFWKHRAPRTKINSFVLISFDQIKQQKLSNLCLFCIWPHWPFKLCSAATFDFCSEDLCTVCSQPPLFTPGFVFCANTTDSGCKRATFIWKKHICGPTRAIKQIVILTVHSVCVCLHWSSSAPVRGHCCLWGNGLPPVPSLIGSIQTLSSLMGLFAALLWTQTHLGPPRALTGRLQGDTCPNLVGLRYPHISFGPTVCLYQFVGIDKTLQSEQDKHLEEITARLSLTSCPWISAEVFKTPNLSFHLQKVYA